MSDSFEDKVLGSGGPVNAVISAVLVAACYLIVPFIIILLLPQVPANLDVTMIRQMLERCMIFSVVLIVIAAIDGYMQRGTGRRLITTIVYCIAGIGWFLFVTNLGNLDGLIHMTSGGFEVTAGVVFTGFLVIYVVFKLLGIIVAYLDYLDDRNVLIKYKVV